MCIFILFYESYLYLIYLYLKLSQLLYTTHNTYIYLKT